MLVDRNSDADSNRPLSGVNGPTLKSQPSKYSTQMAVVVALSKADLVPDPQGFINNTRGNISKMLY